MKLQFNLKKEDTKLRVRMDVECLTLEDKFYRVDFSSEQMNQEGVNNIFDFYKL